MAGRVVVSTLNNDTGVLATQNGMTGIAKAWVQFQGGSGNTAGVIIGSFNVSSITVNSTGNYTLTYTTAMPNANYSFIGSSQTRVGVYTGIVTLFSPSSGTPTQINTSGICILVSESSNGTPISTGLISLAIFSS